MGVETKKPPRSAIVVKTADGRRLKPACPICEAVSWGQLVPPGIPENTPSYPMISAKVGDKVYGMEIQLWVCLNCGHLWHRTGGIGAMEHET